MSIQGLQHINKSLNCFQKYKLHIPTTIYNFNYIFLKSSLSYQINLFHNKRELIPNRVTDRTRFQAAKFSPGLKQKSINYGIDPGAISNEVSKAIKSGLDVIHKKHDDFKEPIPFYLPIIDKLISSHSSEKPKQILIIVPFLRVAVQLLEKISVLTESVKHINVFTLIEGQDYTLHLTNIIISTSKNAIDVFDRKKISWSDLTTLVLYDLDSITNSRRIAEINCIASAVKKELVAKDVSILSKTEKKTQLILISDVIPQWLQSIYTNYFNKKSLYIEHPASRFLDFTLSSEHFAITTLDDQVSSTLFSLIQNYCIESSKILIICKSHKQCEHLKSELEKSNTVQPIVFTSKSTQTEKADLLKTINSGLANCILITGDSIDLLEVKAFDLAVETSIAPSDAIFYERFKKLSDFKITTFVTLLDPEFRRVFEELIEKISMGISIRNVPCPNRSSFFSNFDSDLALDKNVCSRSLIDGNEGYTTLFVQEIKRSLVLCDLIYKKFKLDPLEVNLRQISQTKDHSALVFDAQTSSVPKILKAQLESSDKSYTIKILEELPPLVRGRDELKLNYRANKSLAKSTSVLINRYINKSGNREFDREATDDFTTWGIRSHYSNKNPRKNRGGGL